MTAAEFFESLVMNHLQASAVVEGPNNLAPKLIFGDDASERSRNSQRNMIEKRIIYWMITAERP